MSGISPETLQALGWTLLHFVWQGAALAALFGMSLMLCRSAHARYALGLATLMLMMAAPAITFAWLSRVPDSIVYSGLPEAVSTVATHEITSSSNDSVRAFVAQASQPNVMLWLVQVWFVGVIVLAARTAGGVFWIARIRRRDVEPLPDDILRLCLTLQQRMGLNRHIRYGQMRGLEAPMVLGWFRPLVLVTAQALTGLTVQQLQAVIVHELAHIRRFDAFVNLLQVAAETLLFYHPAVWWVSRRIRIEREVCCDHEALVLCGEPVSYARALALMEQWRAAPSLSMAANRGPLTERVRRLLAMNGTSGRTRTTAMTISALCITAALLAGHGLVEVAHAALDEKPSAAQRTQVDSATPGDDAVIAPPSPAPVPPAAPLPTTAAVPAAAPSPKVAAEAAPARKPTPVVRPQAASRPQAAAQPQAAQGTQSYIAELAAAGFKNLSANELIAMKVTGVTPEYIQELASNGLHPPVEQLIAMKVHGVTADYVREARSVVIDPDAEELIAMRVHDVTPQLVRELQAAGLDARRGRDVIAAKVQGITPELVKSAVDRGFRDLRLEQLIMLKNADVL